MIDPGIFVLADALVAGFLAVGFFVTYALERRFGAFRCWAAAYLLLAVSVITIQIRGEDAANVWVQVIACLTLFAASVLFFLGAVAPQTTKNFKKFIIAATIITLAMLAVFGFASASPFEWELLGHFPAALIAILAGTLVLHDSKGHAKEISLGLAFLAFGTLLVVRGIWFGSIFSNEKEFDAVFIVEALRMVITTILVMVSMAVAMVFRSTLVTVSQLHQQSQTDGLTGLLNRMAFDKQAGRLLEVAHKTRLPTCVLIADLDHFKRVNDTYGHQAGDQVIMVFAQVLKDALDKNYVGGRIGGEEFSVILPDCPIASARLCAQAIRTGLKEAGQGSSMPTSVTVSIGIAQMQPDEPLHSIMSRADKALYVAKKNGRDQVQVASIHGEIEGGALSA